MLLIHADLDVTETLFYLPLLEILTDDLSEWNSPNLLQVTSSGISVYCVVLLEPNLNFEEIYLPGKEL